MSFNAFTSVNFPEIALIRNDRVIRAASPVRCADEGSLRLFDRLNERVFVLKLTPGMSPSVFELLERDYDAVIVETFGIGEFLRTMTSTRPFSTGSMPGKPW